MFPLPRFPAGLWYHTHLMDAFVLCVKWAEPCSSSLQTNLQLWAWHHSLAQPGGLPEANCRQGNPREAAPGLRWAGQAQPWQQMHRELCTLTLPRCLCSVLGQIPPNTPGSASLETETCATSSLHLPTSILQHLLKSSAENSPSNAAVCAGPLSKGYVYSRDYW